MITRTVWCHQWSWRWSCRAPRSRWWWTCRSTGWTWWRDWRAATPVTMTTPSWEPRVRWAAVTSIQASTSLQERGWSGMIIFIIIFFLPLFSSLDPVMNHAQALLSAADSSSYSSHYPGSYHHYRDLLSTNNNTNNSPMLSQTNSNNSPMLSQSNTNNSPMLSQTASSTSPITSPAAALDAESESMQIWFYHRVCSAYIHTEPVLNIDNTTPLLMQSVIIESFIVFTEHKSLLIKRIRKVH